MRTTVILPDELYRLAKERARAEGRTFTSLLEGALRRELKRRDATEHVEYVLAPFSPPSGQGGTLPGVDITNKEQIQAILDEDDFAIQQIRSTVKP